MRSWRLDRSVLRMALRGLSRDLGTAADLPDGETFEALLAVYVRLHDLQRELGDTIAVLDPHLLEKAPRRVDPKTGRKICDPIGLPGGGVFRIRGGADKTVYDNASLVSELAHRIGDQCRLTSVVTENGEVGDPAPIIDAICTVVAKAAGAMAPSFNSWRSGVAKDLGIDLDRYRRKERTHLKPTIEGRTPQSEGATPADDHEAERGEGVSDLAS